MVKECQLLLATGPGAQEAPGSGSARKRCRAASPKANTELARCAAISDNLDCLRQVVRDRGKREMLGELACVLTQVASRQSLENSCDLAVQPNATRHNDLVVQRLSEERVGKAVGHRYATDGALLDNSCPYCLFQRCLQTLLRYQQYLLQDFDLKLATDHSAA